MFTDTIDIFGVQIPTYYLVFGLLLIVLLQLIFAKKDTRLTPEEENVSGLSHFTDPRVYRGTLAMIIVIPGTIFIPALLKAGLSGFWGFVLYAILFYICFLIRTRLGGKNAEQVWLAEDKIERQKNVIEAQRKQQIRDEEERARKLAAENARYAAAPKRPLSPDEITEAARRVADELKNG